MKQDQGPDSSSKPYRRHRSIWGSAGVVLGCPGGPRAYEEEGCTLSRLRSSLLQGVGGLENQPNGSLTANTRLPGIPTSH